jgi:hypothetical protein
MQDTLTTSTCAVESGGSIPASTSVTDRLLGLLKQTTELGRDVCLVLDDADEALPDESAQQQLVKLIHRVRGVDAVTDP